MSVRDEQFEKLAKALEPNPILSMARGISPFVACIILSALLQAYVKPQLQPYSAKLILDIGINIALAVSLTIVNGFTGQFSMGHAGFMAVGGYAAGIVTYYGSMRLFGSPDAAGGALSGMPIRAPQDLPWFTRGDTLFFFSLIIGGIVAALLGLVVGLPSLRLRGDYLAIVTLGFGEIVRVMITRTGPVLTPMRLNVPSNPLNGQMVLNLSQGQSLPNYVSVNEVPFGSAISGTGGALGFSGLPTYTSLFWVYLVAGITVLIAYRLKLSTFGRAFLSIREDEIASEAMGVNTTRYKVWAFVISAFFAGVAGGLFAHTLGVGLTPQAAGFQKSFDIIIMVVLGGLGSISGAAFAALFVTLLPEYLRDPPPVWPAGLAILVAVVIVQSITGRWRLKPLLAVAGATLVVEAALRLCVRYGIDVSNYRMIIFALGLILIMIFRPQGLLGVKEIWDKSLWRSVFRREKGPSG